MGFGALMGVVERWGWRDERVAGGVYATVGVATAVAAGRLAHRAVGAGPTTLFTVAVAVGGRLLDTAAERVETPLGHDDLVVARARLPWLVGRDPSDLDEAEIVRAVVESVAENTVDAVVAPALWGAVWGAPGACAYRAVNTMDAMVGHRSARYARYGTAAARLDDVANFLPARVTAVLVALVRPRAATAVWRAVRTQAPAHPSPNSGVAEAAFAAALGVRLGGVSRYGERTEHRPLLGDGLPPTRADIGRARRLARDVDAALVGLLAAVALWGRWQAARGETTARGAAGRRGVAGRRGAGAGAPR